MLQVYSLQLQVVYVPWVWTNDQGHVGFLDGSVVKNPPANAGHVGSIPRLGRSPGEGNDNPL